MGRSECHQSGSDFRSLSYSDSLSSVLQLVLRRVRRKEDDDHAEGIDEHGDAAGAGVVFVELGGDGAGAEDAEAGEDAAEVERDAGAGGPRVASETAPADRAAASRRRSWR